MLLYFMVIWNFLRTFGIFYDQLAHLCSFGTFSGFGNLATLFGTTLFWRPQGCIMPSCRPSFCRLLKNIIMSTHQIVDVIKCWLLVCIAIVPD
jgi:hypothetical protein